MKRLPIAFSILLMHCVPLPPASSTQSDGGAGVNVVREKSIPIDGDPNGLWWDATEHVLYIADDDHNRVLKWTDDAGLSAVGALPAITADSPGLGQIVRTMDGTLVVTRFGGGSAGDVAFIQSDGTAGRVPGLNSQRRRLGLTQASDGSLFDSYFVKTNGGRAGSVAKLTLDGSEVEVMSGLKKPVGVLVVGDVFYVSDQDLNEILKAPVANPADVSVVAQIESPDLLSAGPDGSLFTGGLDGAVRRISKEGDVSTLRSGFLQPRGSTYDAEGKRLFFANHDGASGSTPHHTIEIIPVE